MPLRRWTTVVLLTALWAISDASAALPDSVARVMQTHGLSAEHVSIWVQPADGGPPLLTLAPDRPRNPASVTKLPVSYAALEILGPTYQWRTDVYTDRPPVDGVVRGDLWLRGSGDPYLVTEEFWKLVGGIRRAGVRRIEGDLVFDVSHFALEPEDPGAFDNEPFRAYNQPPHALLVNFNVLRFQIDGDRGGNGVAVSVDPPLPGLRVNNHLQPAGGGCGSHQGVRYTVEETGEVTLAGQHPASCNAFNLLRVAVPPEEYAYDLFRLLWRQWDGEFAGGWRRDVRPEGAGRPLYTHHSPPLGDLVRRANKYSSNVMTRHFKLAIAAERYGTPATVDNGNEAILAFLREKGVDTNGIVMDNAAGLSRNNRFSARQVARILEEARRSPYMPEFVSSLALSGMDGTMRRRFRDGPEAGRMHLKTGTLNHVSAVAGYVKGRAGEDYIVVVMVNANNAHWGPGRAVQDAVLSWTFRQ